MSENSTNVPKIRFPGFTNAWEQHSLSKVGDFVRTSVDPQATPNDSFVEYSMPSYDNGRNPDTVFGDSMQSVRLKISGDVLLINKLNVRQKRIWLVEDAPSNAVASSEFMPFTSTEIDLVFLEQLMLSDKTTSDLESISSGTSNSQKRITPSDVLKYLIKLPVDRAEQEKIGSFFKNIDNLIILHQRKLNHLQDEKKSLLQKMFPKNGADVPEIRFLGFTDAWEQRKLVEISDIRTGPFGSTLHAEDYVEEGTPIITTEHFKTGNLLEQKDGIPQVSDEDLLRLQSYVLKTGDIVFSRVGSVDINALVTPFQSGWLFSGRVLRVRTDNNIDSQFLHYELSTSRAKNDVIARAVGQTMPSINTEILKQTKVFIPTEIKEQKQIGAFFTNIDHLITLHQRKLNHLQEQKKALLQQMFV